jgi:HK97 family phage prohead protease
VFLNSHRYGDVTATLGKALVTEVRQVDGKDVLFQRVEFAVDVSPQARVAYGLYRGGFLNAVSVGFIPLVWEDARPEQVGGGCEWTRRYLSQELVEVSAVAVPANSEALMLGVRSGAVAPADVMELLADRGGGGSADATVRALWAAMFGGRRC